MERESFELPPAGGQGEDNEGALESPQKLLEKAERGVISDALWREALRTESMPHGAGERTLVEEHSETNGVLRLISKMPQSAKKLLLVMMASTAFVGGMGSMSSGEAASGAWGNNKEEVARVQRENEAAIKNDAIRRKQEYENWKQQQENIRKAPIPQQRIDINVNVPGLLRSLIREMAEERRTGERR